jgi:hypothetical protein
MLHSGEKTTQRDSSSPLLQDIEAIKKKIAKLNSSRKKRNANSSQYYDQQCEASKSIYENLFSSTHIPP